MRGSQAFDVGGVEAGVAIDRNGTDRVPVREHSAPARTPSMVEECRGLAELRGWLLSYARGFGFYGGRYVHLGHAFDSERRFARVENPSPRRAALVQRGETRAARRLPLRFLSTSGSDEGAGTIEHWLAGDPTAGVVPTAFAPFVWLTRGQGGETPEQRAWLDAERARGVGAGLAIPVQDYVAGPAYLSLFGADEASVAQLIETRAAEFAFTGTRFHVRARALVPTSDGLTEIAHITSRERQCLRLAAQGRTVEESGRLLNISGRTVEFHLRNAGEKLGAGTKVRAVALAVRTGLVDA